MHSVEEVLHRILEDKYFLPFLEIESQPCSFVQHKLCRTKPELCSAELGLMSPRPWSLWWEMGTQKTPGHSITQYLSLLSVFLAELQPQVWQTFT